MRVYVTCEYCGWRGAVLRRIRKPERFWIICHSCEGPLRVTVTAADIESARPSPGPFENLLRSLR